MGSGIDKKPDGCKPVGFCGIGLILLLAAVSIHNPDREMGVLDISEADAYPTGCPSQLMDFPVVSSLSFSLPQWPTTARRENHPSGN